jgi:hypothetical protein
MDTQMLVRAATAPIDMVSGAALVQITMAVLPMLQPYSGAAMLFNEGLKVTLTRDSGGVTVPSVPVVPSLKFVAPGAPKPVVQGVSVGARVDPHKIAGITVASGELFQQANIELILQQLLAESAGPTLDAAVFSALPGDASRPPGLFNGIASLTPATGTGTDALLADLQTLMRSVAPVVGASRFFYIMNPVQAVSAQYRTYEDIAPRIITSGTVPEKTVIVVAANAVVSAMGVPMFETATHTALHMNDVPLPIVSGGVVASPLVSSMFQTNSIAVKMQLDVSWALRSPQAVAWIQNVVW